MPRFLILVALCLPASTAGGQSASLVPAPVAAGFSDTRVLRGAETHSYLASGPGELLVTVENLGRGTILTVGNSVEGGVRRSANWRGPEYHYSAVVRADQPVPLEVTADEPIAPPGEYRITVEAFDSRDPRYEAERAMFLGADYHLRHYFGADDARHESLEQFLQAADVFRSIRSDSREADALFEGAAVYLELGEHDEAEELLAAAESIWRALDDQRGIATAEIYQGLIAWNTNRPDEAITLFREAAARRGALGDSFFVAQALNNMGLVYRELGDARSAIEFFRQALDIWQGSEDLLSVNPEIIDFDASEDPPWLEHVLIAMNNTGWAYEVLADTANTERVLMQALALSKYLNHGRITAEVKNNLGRLKYKTGKLQEAIDYLNEALDYFTAGSADELWAAHVRHSKALVYRASGDIGRAELELQEALRLRTVERDPVGRADTMLQLAELNIAESESASALQLVETALDLLGTDSTNRLTMASAHDVAGRAFLAAGQHEEALQNHDRAVDLYRAAGDLRGEASARANRGLTHLAMGLDLEFMTELSIALNLAVKVEDRLLQFRVMTDQGRALLQRGNYVGARETAGKSLQISETLHDEIVDPNLLRDFAATQRDAYDVLVNAELRLGRIEEAWIAADSARARRFADLLSQNVAGLSQLSPDERSRYESLLHMRAARSEERSELLSRTEIDDSNEKMQRIRAELASIIDEIEQIQAKARQYPQQRREQVTLADVQRELDDGEIILEYYFGDLGNGVWRITQSDIVYRPIPATDQIFQQINSVVDSVRRFGPVDDDALRKVSRALLAVTAGAGTSPQRLIVVPDGSLYYLPFSILLDPTSDYRQPVVELHDVSYLPSVASLFELRARENGRGEGIAIIADPVFENADPRLGQLLAGRTVPEETILESDLKRSAERAGRNSFPRLPGTREETEVISGAVRDIEIRTIMDTDANRDLVLGGALDNYSIVHFATHGILDPQEPALSGLVLSGVTADGAPRPQFLRSQDIVALKLQADLVVLSGCDTGLGLMVRGEGLHSLSRAFFYAGARQVISSLWQVPDQATAALMGHFYAEIFQNGQKPVTALRHAKMAVRSDRRWRNPHYWAAFVVQGDWLHTPDMVY